MFIIMAVAESAWYRIGQVVCGTVQCWNQQLVAKREREREVVCGQVWWPILGICALHLTHPRAHTQQWTHTRSSRQPMLRRPGSSWGFGALLKGLTSVVVLKVERVLVIHSPPPTIPAGPEIRTHDLRVTSPTLYPLGHNCPKTMSK